MDNLVFTLQEFATSIRVSRQTAKKLLEQGNVHFVRAGDRILIPKWAVEEWLRNRRQK